MHHRLKRSTLVARLDTPISISIFHIALVRAVLETRPRLFVLVLFAV